MKPKIELTDTVQDMLFKISEGNPGALNVCIKIIRDGEKIDPYNAMGGIGVILSFDTLGLYGSKIWMLFKDVCGSDIASVLAVLRAWQLGFIEDAAIHHAVDNRGRGINVADLYAKVVAELPSFAAPANDAK